MKHIKIYEDNSNNELMSNFKNNLDDLVKYFDEDDYKRKTYSKTYRNDSMIEFGRKAPDGTLMIFLRITVSMWNVNNYFQIKIEPIYIGVDAWSKTEEFKKYFASLAKPLSYFHDTNIEFTLSIDKFKILTELLTIDEYKLRADLNRYNI